MSSRESDISSLRDIGVVIEARNYYITRVLFPSSMSREAVINATITLVLTSDYDCHEIETLSNGSIRLTVHMDS